METKAGTQVDEAYAIRLRVRVGTERVFDRFGIPGVVYATPDA
jgi:hypothetical protein